MNPPSALSAFGPLPPLEASGFLVLGRLYFIHFDFRYCRRLGDTSRTLLTNSDLVLRIAPTMTSADSLCDIPRPFGFGSLAASTKGLPRYHTLCFPPYLPDLRELLPYRYWVNRLLPTLPKFPPPIRFLFVRPAFRYRLPSSICYLLDSAELLVLPPIGRTVDFHHQTHVRCWAHERKNGRPGTPSVRFLAVISVRLPIDGHTQLLIQAFPHP